MSPPIQLNSDTAAPSAASADDMASFDEYNVASVHLADANDVYRAHLDDHRETLKHEASIAADSASKAAHTAAEAAALATNSLSAAGANDAAAAAWKISALMERKVDVEGQPWISVPHDAFVKPENTGLTNETRTGIYSFNGEEYLYAKYGGEKVVDEDGKPEVKYVY